ncbi:dienelactone hydrolase family protein [Cellulomonas bogoriensis]|uniref:Dienelactone hydrolase n=1 Tax=Cellulomonas bogoriensis 69B4 = DSM 16987 TaxID=1386082 RepID=A0A0A0C245_9CELL|nr:dienelactone hydrolase family protein [Cellulomonas bogoriensis]KGM13479.1 dienelactone hydrolase [Cellulomonas bogoriensis 69B4 = DSM 16987]
MAEVVLFHHAHGLTAGVATLAHDLVADGHHVHTPDLFEGRTFEALDDGVDHAEALGTDVVLKRGARAVEGLAEGLVYIGLSLGVLPAQQLAQTRPGARGAVLVGSCVPVEFFGGWPEGVPVHVHGMDADPWFVGEGDLDAARELVEGAADGQLFLYPGGQHLFIDPSLPAHDAAAHARFMETLRSFLVAVDSRG